VVASGSAVDVGGCERSDIGSRLGSCDAIWAGLGVLAEAVVATILIDAGAPVVTACILATLGQDLFNCQFSHLQMTSSGYLRME
jgi:hypothetical protein